MKNKYVAIIPARGGSKGVPHKNTKTLNGIPLIEYSIKSALECDFINEVVVTSDCKRVFDIVNKYSGRVKLIKRPDDLATDTARSEDVVSHCVKALNLADDHCFILLQPTSPLRTCGDITDAVEKFERNSYKSLFSVKESEHPIEKTIRVKNSKPIPEYSWDFMSKPRQLIEKSFSANGAIYVSKLDSFVENLSFYVQPCGISIMDSKSSVDIDSDIDFMLAEALLKCENS